MGCGLGDILVNIKAQRRLGYDLDKRAINVARILHPLMKFEVGGIEDIEGENLSYFC